MSSYEKRWKIIKDLKETGQAWTHIVEDTTGNGEYEFVLKRLKNLKRLERFEREITALSELEHPNITKLVDWDVTAERPWFVQEYCPGGDLQDYVSARDGIDPIFALDLILDVARALIYAHSEGKVHRDIKPANIYLGEDNGPAVLGDFGLCWVDDGERLTLTDEAVGSFRYMAPELADGVIEEPEWMVDVYSLGKVLYFMIAGKIFDREKHRLPEWDLKKMLRDFRLEHINLLLDNTITEKPESRMAVEHLSSEANIRRHLIQGSYAPLRGDIRSKCKYCGLGVYVPVAWEDGEYSNFMGFQPAGLNSESLGFRALMCDICGNMQIFANHKIPTPWFPSKEDFQKWA